MAAKNLPLLMGAVLCVCLAALPRPDAAAGIVRQMNAAEITAAARIIFSGVCLGGETRFDEAIQRETCVFRFQVERMLKGPLRRQVAVKTSKVLVDLGQVPQYKAGDQVLLFLYAPSRLGFSSPVGLGQGKFAVRHRPDGTRTAVNENNNRNLFRGMDLAQCSQSVRTGQYANRILGMTAARSGPVDLEAFIALVSDLVNR